MESKDLFHLEFSENGSLSIEFSGDFLSLSQEEQLRALESFFWEKTWEPSPTEEVSETMAQHEIRVIVAETLLAKLKRGERIEADADIDISFGDLFVD